MKITRITWLDATSHYGWKDLDEKYELCEIKSVGYVIHETKDYVALTTSISSLNHGLDPILIPKKMILKRR